jgi:hypothetical protein
MKEWNNEELDELHGSLHSFLSFITDESIEVMTKRFGENQMKVAGHVKAVKSRINEMLEEHGGRFYTPTPITENMEGNA